MNEQFLRQFLPSLGLRPESLPALVNLLQSPQGQPLMQMMMSIMQRQQGQQMQMPTQRQLAINMLPPTLFGGLLSNGQGASD